MRVVSILMLSFLAFPGNHARPAGEPLGWMAGCWQMTRGATVIDEHWLPPLGGMMLGTGRTVKNGQVQEYEFVVLRINPNGATYEAHPSGQDTATFTSHVAPAGDQVVFENPSHDFPQKVGYRRMGGDSLLAWIEGDLGNGPRKIEFPYARVGCTTP